MTCDSDGFAQAAVPLVEAYTRYFDPHGICHRLLTTGSVTGHTESEDVAPQVRVVPRVQVGLAEDDRSAQVHQRNSAADE